MLFLWMTGSDTWAFKCLINFISALEVNRILYFCQGETASQVWSYLKGVQHASFVQDSLSAFTKTCLQGSSIKSKMGFLG